jgi:ketosteroid isomerase-like protein
MTAMPDLSMESNRRLAMTENKQTIERYMEGFRRGDHAMILSCLTDDVEWVIPGAFHLVGKDAYDREIENPAYVGRPAITITRVTEENNVVVAEGSVLTQRKEGSLLRLAFCDVFEMERGKIKRLISYLVEITAA